MGDSTESTVCFQWRLAEGELTLCGYWPPLATLYLSLRPAPTASTTINDQTVEAF